MKTFYLFISVLLTTALMVSCASSSGSGGGSGSGGSGSGGGGGGGGTVESSIFSHSSYTFIPESINLTAPPLGSATPVSGTNPTHKILLGSVLIKESEINKLVTAEINKLITAEDSKVDANDINIIDNYTIEYSFADDAAKDPSSTLNRYLTIAPNSNSRGARIYASNPFAFPVSLADILADVPAVTVTADITIIVSSLVKTEMSIVRTVSVHFPEVVDTFPDINDAVPFDLSKVSTKGGPVTPDLMRAQSYIGNLSGSFVKGTVINGSTATSFTSLWMAANANLATDPRAGKIFPDGDNVFKISDLLNVSELPSLPAAETGIIQSITVTITPEGANEFNYTYPVPAPAPALLSGTASADTPISVDALNGDSSTNNSLWKAISDANSTFTETNAAGIHVLNISIGWSFTYTYQRDFQPNDVTLPDGFVLNRTVLFAEEQAAITTIPIKGVNNALNSYGFAPAPGTGEQRTIFFALLNSSSAVQSPFSISQPLCSPQSIYLDNIDTQVKSATSFNYEDRDDEADRLFTCVLGASFNGADYQPLVARINATATPNSDSNPISGFLGCSTTGDERCYYASLTINITNLDEAPTITYPPLSIAEGVGPADTDYPGNNFSPALGTLTENLATTGNLSVVPGNITIADTDEVANRTTNLPVNAAETKVMSVSPTHGNGLFSIVKQDGGNNLFNLRVDASKLDYEKFTDNELKEGEGKAIYMVTISTQDTDGTVANKPVKPLQVPVEITDVIFAPVTAGSNIVRLGFTKATNIENRIVNGRKRIMLLSGASMIAHGRNTLGTVKAVDPETNSDNELFYAVSPNDSNLEQTSNNFAVVDGFGDGDVQNLVLNKLGLTTGFTIEVQVFYRPDNFDQNNPADISDALSNNNVIALETPISIDVEVDDTAYSDIDRANLLNPANSPVFNTRQFTGSVTEATAGDNVIGVSSSGTSFPPFNQNFIDISQEAANLGISPEFALVGAGGFGAFNAPQLQSLGIDPTDSALFSIDKTTGAISLQGESTVEFPDFYSVVVRLADADDIDNAENAFSHDYATVNILVNDINTAPVISDSNDFIFPDIQVVNGIGSYAETANELTLNVTINENTPAGTVLARFTVTDDNDDMFAEYNFLFGADTRNRITQPGIFDNFYEGAVKLTFAPGEGSEGKQKTSTATLTLVKSINFEDFATDVINNGNTGSAVITNDTITLSETISISDKGRYEYNPLTPLTLLIESQPKPISPAQDVLSTSLAFNLVVLDVAEKPLIDTENSVTSGEIMENAPLGSPVTGININIVNINATDADALIYELGTEFAEVFNANATADGMLQLIVADVDKLENLGDGQVHTSTLTITNNTGGTGLQDKSNTITIQVRVIDVLQPINPIAVNMTGLQVAETDVDGGFSDGGSDGGSDGNYVIKDNLFVYNLTDVSKDADDIVRIGRREPAPLVTISYAITDVSLESSTPDDATDIDVTDGINSPLLPLLSLNTPDENKNVGLAIEDTDYVEASLFGNITATLAFTGTFIGNTLPSSINSMDFTVEVIKANPKNVEYNTTSNNAPVYTFKYIQSRYADEITADNVGADAISASSIVSGGLTTEGARPQINLTGDTYNTALVRLGDDDDNDTYFIERDFTRLNKIQVTKNNQQKADDGVILIPFTSNENIATANIQILSEGTSGKLEDSADNFDSYFDIKVNNTYNFANEGSPEDIRKVLLITQKQFAVINNSGVIDETNKYNALDTIPLFQGETEATNRTYYIRVSQGDSPSNASNYALAQVHLNIEAAGLNIPAVVGGLFIGETSDRNSVLANLTTGIGNISENSIIPNAFGTHSLYLSINNQDHETENEGTTIITVSVPIRELVPTPNSNRATNGQLIALSPVEGSSDNLPGANVVVINSTGVGDTNTRQIRFALARNVHGSATINVHIQENDAEDIEIYSDTHTFTLNVNEDTSGNTNGNNAPTLTPTLSNDVGIINVNSNNLDFNLTEDIGTEGIALLAITDDTESKSITIVPGDVATNDNGNRSQSATVAVENVVRVEGLDGLSNTKNVDVFDYDSNIINNNIMSYKKDGWGITNITYRVIETEPRGFGDMVTATIYNGTKTSRVTVTQENDDAVFVEATAVKFNLNEFENPLGTHNATSNPQPKPLTLTYSDPDLKFANFALDGTVVPAMIIPGTQTSDPSPLADTLTLTITPVSVEAPNSELFPELFTVTFMSDFSNISAADYNIINALGEGGVYNVSFTGDNVEEATASIRIVASTNDHVIAESSNEIFKSNGEEVNLIEDASISLYMINQILIEDADFARPLAEQENITFSIDSVIEKVRESSGDTPRDLTDKFSWSSTVRTDETDNRIHGNFLTQEDVGTYTVTWSTTERYSAAGGPRTHTGFFVLNFQNNPSPLILQGGDITIDYPHDGMGALNRGETNRTIATIEGIDITGEDLNLPASLGYGILLTITPENIDRQGNNSFTNADGDEVSVIEFPARGREFSDDFALKHFISFSDIMPGGTLPAFKLVANSELAGDEFNITVNAALAQSDSGETKDANPVEEANEQAGSITLATEYDIQSPPSDVEITTLPSTGVTIVADEITTTEGRQGFIDVGFTDKNIEDGELERFAGGEIDAFNLTMVFYNSDKTERQSSIEIINPDVFVYSEDTGSVQIFLPNANKDVGVKQFEITVTDNRTKNAPAATLNGTLNIIGADSEITMTTQLMTDIPGVTQELNYNNNDDITVLVNISGDDFFEGGENYGVSDFSFADFGFFVVERGQNLAGPWVSRVNNTCSLDSVSLDGFQDITDTIADKTNKQRFLKFTIGVQELDNATLQGDGEVGGNCARLDYDIVGTYFEDFKIQLNNTRSLRNVTQYHNSEGIVGRYSRTGIRDIVPTISNLVTDGLADVRYAAGRSAAERTFTVHANFSDGDPDDNDNEISYRLTSSNINDCPIGDEFDNAMYTASWNIELREGIAIGTECPLTLTVSEGVGSTMETITIQVPKSPISFVPPVIVSVDGNIIGFPYTTGIFAGDNVSISYTIQDNDGDGVRDEFFKYGVNDPGVPAIDDMCRRVNPGPYGTYDDINRRVTFDITVNKNITTDAECLFNPSFDDNETVLTGFPRVTVTFTPRPDDNVPPIFFAASIAEVSQFTSVAGEAPAGYNFINIPSSSSIGYSVGNVSARDANGDTLTYNITAKYSNDGYSTDIDNDLFQINPTSGEITLKAQAAASDLGTYQFNATVSDGQAEDTEATISVTVIDSSPPVFTSTPYNFDLSLLETGTVGIIVGNVSAVDAEGTPFNYSLANSDDSFEDLFELATYDNVDGSRNIFLRRAVILSDFAAFPVTSQVVATLQVGGFSSEADVTVNLITDFDGDGVMDFYDADLDNSAVGVIGNGERGNPYIISNIYQLQAIAGVDHEGMPLGSSDFTNNSFLYGTDAADQLTKHYELANDINASDTNNAFWNKPAITGYTGHGWTPIAGKSGQSFSGSFSGEGYAISNLNMTLRAADTTDAFGLFGINSGNISAVGLENIEMRIQSVENRLQDLYGRPTFAPNQGNGGLVGENEPAGVIQYSYVSGLVNATGDKVGGLVGSNKGEISYSYSTAAVEGRLDSGGLVGSNTGRGIVLSSYATGNVNGDNGHRNGISGEGDVSAVVGSLVGHIKGDASNIVKASYATGVPSKAPYDNGLPYYLGSLVGQLETGMIVFSYWYNNPVITDIKGIGNDRASGGHTGLSNAQLQGCELDGMVISDVMPEPATCANLFPSSNWGGNTMDGITRRWIFNADEYPSLNAVRSSDNKQLLPSAVEQECQRNGMPLGCDEIEFVAVSGSVGSKFTPAAGATPANYDFAAIPFNSPAGYSVGNVSATDPDGKSIEYSVYIDDSALFQINLETGEITLKAIAAVLGEYTFSVNATNDQDERVTATISVTVRDFTPPVFASTPYNFNLSLSEANAAGVVVGNISATDADGTDFDYSLADSNAFFEALFEPAAADNADGTRNIILSRAATLSDFAASSVTFVVTAMHREGGSLSVADITVNLNNDLQFGDDSDANGVIGPYDASPHDAAVDVTGNGEPGDPYIISNIYQLQAIAGVDHEGTALDSSTFTNNSFLYGTDAADQLTKHYKLNQNIDASATNNTEWNKTAIGSDNFVGRGWTPIAGKDGESFSGSFNGDGYAINGLTSMLRQGDNSKHFGLFGTNNGNITALGLQNINMIIQAEGNNYPGTTSVTNIVGIGTHAGGLVGLNQNNGIISYSYTTGLVNASLDAIGGLIGVNQGEISYSYSTATVQGAGDTGGLVGTNEGGALLSSYATGYVRGSYGIKDREGTTGGLAGSISSVGALIHTSYAAGMVSDATPSISSLLGGVVAERSVLNRGGVVTIESSYWDSDITGVSMGVGYERYSNDVGDTTGTDSLTTAQLQGCELDGMVISGTTPAPTCATLFPSSDWGEDIDSTADSIITRGWIFNADEYPSLSVVRSSDSKQLLPSAAEQECHRNGMPLGCYKIQFSAASGLKNQFTAGFGATPASYSFAGIPLNSPIGYSVGNVSATDANNDAISYYISGGTDDTTLFQINQTTGEITLKVQATNLAEYQFNVIASDDNGESTTATISVTVVDLSPPTFNPTTYNFNLLLSEANTPGVVVGNVSATDADGSPFDYSLAGSNDLFGDLFELAANDNPDGTRNIVLRRGATLSDFAVSPITFQVVATNQVGGASSSAVITVQFSHDSDADGIVDIYDAFPHDASINVMDNVIGSGESDDPYIISNIYQLQAIAGVDHTGTALNSSIFTNNKFLYGIDAADQLTKHYKLANDINASATNNTDWNKPVIGADNFVGRGWMPIAGKSDQSFSGSFNGDGYAINELTIHLRQGDNSKWFGLFGINNGNITVLGLQNINMIIQAEGNNYQGLITLFNIVGEGTHAGGLVGLNQNNGIISYSYATGLVNASTDAIGGLVGLNQGEISYSYSTATVQGAGDTGGLVGTNEEGAILSSYATGYVGTSYGIANRGGTAGGLAGSINTGARIHTSYASGLVTDQSSTSTGPYGGVVAERGRSGVTIESSYWDSDTTSRIRGIVSERERVPNKIGDEIGTFSLTTAQLQGCELDGMVISGVTPDPVCTGLFPSSDWGEDIDSTAGSAITRSWVFNADEYPSLSAVDSSGSKQLLPLPAEQECHRNGMPLGCE